MWSRHASPAFARGVRITEWIWEWCLPPALCKAACYSWSLHIRWSLTPSQCGWPSPPRRKQFCLPSTISSYWLSVATTYLWVPVICSATHRWPSSWMCKRRCTACSFSPWSNIWKLMLLCSRLNLIVRSVENASHCTIGFCGSRHLFSHPRASC